MVPHLMVKLVLELLNGGLCGRSCPSFVQRGHLVNEGRRQEMGVLGSQRSDLLQNEAVLLRLHPANHGDDKVQCLLGFLLQ